MIWFALLLAACAVSLRASRVFPSIAVRSVGVLAILFGLWSCFAVVPAGHAGIPVVFGRVQDRSLPEGLSIVNPFAHVYVMTVRTETYTMSSVRDEGPVKGDDSITALSADGLMMPLDVTVAYRLVGSDAPWLFRNIGPNYIDKVIRPAARTAVREAIAGFTSQESYSTRREALAQSMQDLLTARLRDLLTQTHDFANRRGFIIEQVMIRNVQLPAK